MKKFIFLFAVFSTFCLTASAQFDFTSKNGEKFSTNSKPDYKEPLGGGLFVDNYYIVSGSELIIYYVPVSNGDIYRNRRDERLIRIKSVWRILSPVNLPEIVV